LRWRCGAAVPALAASQDAHRLNEMAVALTSQGRYEDAAALFTQALRLSPGDEVIRRNLAGVRTVLGHQYLQAGSPQAHKSTRQPWTGPNELAAFLGLGDAFRRRRPGRRRFYRRAVAVNREPRHVHRLGRHITTRATGAALSEWSGRCPPGDAACGSGWRCGGRSGPQRLPRRKPALHDHV
jgi:tetratricopeptide (TPR) repeat protein